MEHLKEIENNYYKKKQSARQKNSTQSIIEKEIIKKKGSDVLVCNICGEKYQRWSKFNHDKNKFHKKIKEYRIKYNLFD